MLDAPVASLLGVLHRRTPPLGGVGEVLPVSLPGGLTIAGMRIPAIGLQSVRPGRLEGLCRMHLRKIVSHIHDVLLRLGVDV